ncbi:hypothetical protein ACODT5_06880 [Streptomyces sp. 5.8]|uniref:hypothetical protein n=1 Tax=Streptomyces sp. 5.8 TaxID=3406571 RepID=UPI003BB656CD
MGGLLGELGKKLAERWLTLLVLPGVLLLATLASALTLGHLHALDLARLTHEIDRWAASPRWTTTGRLAVVLTAILLASAVAGLAAQAAGSAIERVSLAADWTQWPWGARQLARHHTATRRARWDRHAETYQMLLGQERARITVPSSEGSSGARTHSMEEARTAMLRIAEERPARPTWIGDRINATAIRLERQFDVDLGLVWPHLWLMLPDTARTEVTAARGRLTGATTLLGWGLLYAAIGTMWWPGLLVSTVVCVTGWRRSREAADAYSLLLEASSRLYMRELADQVGFDHIGLLNPQIGGDLSDHIKGP